MPSLLVLAALAAGRWLLLPSPPSASKRSVRTWELSGGFVDLSRNPALYTYTDLPLSSAVGQQVEGGGQPLAYLNALTGSQPTIDLAVDPRNSRSFGGFTSPWSMPYSGAVAWVGQRRFVALLPYMAGSRLTLWSYDFDAMDGGRVETPSPPLDSCAVRVDDAVTALGADGGATGVAWFAVFTPAACEGLPAGASLVRVGDGQVTKFPDAGLGGSSLRLAARNGHVWLASEAVGGGFELRSFDVSGDTPVSDFERPRTLTNRGDWAQVDVTVDGQGRPYVVGNSSLGVRVASFELDGGERFVLPVPETTGVTAVAAAWTSRGLAIAGNCDGAVRGVCAADAGNFLVLVRVPR